MGKSFENQIKTNKSNSRSRTTKTIKKYDNDAEDTPFTSKQREVFNKLVDERRKKITDLEKVNSDDLMCKYKGNTAGVKFDKFDNALNTINKIQNGEIDLDYVKNNQEKFKTYLAEIKKGNIKHRSK